MAVALALTAALDRDPPRHLGVDLVLAGAGEGPALGMRAQVRRLRRRLRREQVARARAAPLRPRPAALLDPGRPRPAAAAAPAADRAGGDAPRTRSATSARRAHRGASCSGAYVARAAGYPAIAIGCLDADGLAPGAHQHTDVPDALDPGAMTAALELCLGLVDRLDADVGRRT